MNSQISEIPLPRLIAWEVTRTCNLNCKHCRAAAKNQAYPDEFSTAECLSTLNHIAAFAQPIIILTGGEPMLRPDIFQIARHGSDLGLRMVMAPCGFLVNETSVRQMQAAGIQCISISLDGATAESHDNFRRVPGAFAIANQAIEAARTGGLAFQINTTITRHNLAELPAIMELSLKLGAITFNPFLLVPTGRGSDLADQELTPEQYEQTLHWLAEQQARGIPLRVTCAPHYQRIVKQVTSHESRVTSQPIADCGLRIADSSVSRASCPRRPSTDPAVLQSEIHNPKSAIGRFATGCMGGKTFAFISHVGKVQICGFLEESAGDLRAAGLDFQKIWKESSLFQQMRQVEQYRGKCSWCEFRYQCGGCRARAYALSGDYLAAEPFCVYQPKNSQPR